jgi:transcriptional regulator NrdR family protein
MQLSVIKANGTTEEYLHTKVFGTFSRALDDIGQTNIFAAEQFAEAVTFHLYHNNHSSSVKSDNIHNLIVTVLNETGYPDAAEALTDHRMYRNIKRSRIEVIEDHYTPGSSNTTNTSRWNKTKIVKDLTQKYDLDKNLARAIAASVEEKVLKLDMTQLHSNLVEQLVISETNIMVRAEQQLEPVLT